MVLLGLGPWEKVTEAAQAKRVANSFRPLVQWRRRTVVEAAPEPTDREASMPEPDPSHIMQVGMGFFASKTLLSAVELGLFTELAKQPMTGAEIVRSLGLNHRAVPDFPIRSWHSGSSNVQVTDLTRAISIRPIVPCS